MRIGIVGSEGAKFTEVGERKAKIAIHDILHGHNAKTVVSGHCHLGGIDIWAEEIGKELELELLIFPPKSHNWSTGYKPRNIQIAANSDILFCIAPNKLPEGFKGMTFKECYHCVKAGRNGTDHVKSGGCWTLHKAAKMGKRVEWIVVEN